MAKIVDPDQLERGTEIVIDTTAKTIQLVAAGNLDNLPPGATSGVTLQAVYSKLKELWKDETDLNKFRFPLRMFTKTDGILQNSWSWAGASTRNLIRDGGWEEVSGDQYAGIISLGNFDDDTDQAYYQQVIGYDQSTSNFDKTGNLNEAILIKVGGGSDFTGFFRAFLRIRDGTTHDGKTYAEYNLLTEQGLTLLEPVLYRLPLANTIDLKIDTTITDANIDANTPYTGMKLNYLKGVGFTAWANTTVYPAESVVQDNGRWYFTAAGGTSSGTGVADDTGVTDWAAYDGERQIGTNYYAFNRLLEANDGTDLEVYQWAQRQLRKTTTINANDSLTLNQRSGLTVNGTVAELLMEYVGDTLKTNPGLYIDNFNTDSTNNLVFRDITVDGGGVDANTMLPLTSTERQFPFVATGNINFSDNLVSETNADTLYRMYFSNAGGNEFDTVNAIIVNDNDGNPIQGQIDSTPKSFTFDYDGNNQGGRTAGTDAAVVIVAQGLNDSVWVSVNHTITRASGQTVNVNAEDERNYSNPA
jgi:hypothetical protein